MLTLSEQAAMRGVVWKPGCPVGLNDLRRVESLVVGFDGTIYRGGLVVHKRVAPAVKRILTRLFEAGFPIEAMEPMETFGGDDDRSTKANNSSGFNCRRVSGRPKTFSEHAYGRAIDINPVQNPYVRSDGSVLDPMARRYLDRSGVAGERGVLTTGDAAVKAFRAEGWYWGGLWQRGRDYQHFSATGR